MSATGRTISVCFSILIAGAGYPTACGGYAALVTAQDVNRLRHYDNLGTARFVTFSCYMRLASLQSGSAGQYS